MKVDYENPEYNWLKFRVPKVVKILLDRQRN